MDDLQLDREAYTALGPTIEKIWRGTKAQRQNAVYESIGFILRKWRQRQLTEIDAWWLMQVFPDATGREIKPPFDPRLLRLVRAKHQKSLSPDSLNKLASYLGKPRQTIRRWCKQGLVPGAYQTAGGHWRYNGGVFGVMKLQTVLPHFARRPKNLLHSRAWKSYSKKTLPLLVRGIPTLYWLDAELSEVNPMVARSTVPPLPSNKAQSLFHDVHAAGERATALLMLQLAAKTLHREGGPVNAGTLAQRLGTTRRTLFRRYRKGRQVQKAIEAAYRPLLNEGEESAPGESVHDQVIANFASIELPAKPKRTITRLTR